MSNIQLTSQLLQNVLASLPDGILIVSGDRKMVYTNDRFRELWGIPLDFELDDEGAAIMRYALSRVVDPEGFVSVIERLHHSGEQVEDEIKLMDGRSFKRRSVAFEDQQFGRSRIWIFTDITAIRNSHIDKMTGLYNRNHFEQVWQDVFEKVNNASLMGVALFDIDHFKLFNDTYGHIAGDAVLRKIGEVILKHLQRSSDAGYRVGGEEFCVQVSGRSTLEIQQLIENIRVDVEMLGIEHIANPPFDRVTISCGLGIYDSPQNSDKVYHHVDQALYISKAKGRNRITLANNLSLPVYS